MTQPKRDLFIGPDLVGLVRGNATGTYPRQRASLLSVATQGQHIRHKRQVHRGHGGKGAEASGVARPQAATHGPIHRVAARISPVRLRVHAREDGHSPRIDYGYGLGGVGSGVNMRLMPASWRCVSVKVVRMYALCRVAAWYFGNTF